MHSGLVVAREGDSYSLVEFSVVHLPFVGQVGPGCEGKHPLLVSLLSNIPSWTVKDIAYRRLELDNLSYHLYAPIYPNFIASLS
jgi:hypothetical protein